ncbi:MAG: tetratricopeptide repeat protein [Halothiobacillaceae bacterium]|nr:MAG: tetratricopeptide repeat protein [Halothiobacillaceae bacterium]
MAYDANEEEQVEAFKRWWRENGVAVIGGLALAVVITLGWQWWQGQREAKAHLAGQVYAELLAKLDSAPAEARAPAERLLSDFAGTTYADLAALALARVEVEGGQADAARVRLQHLVDNGRDESIKFLARLRLARLDWGMGDAEAALRQLDTAWPEAFMAEAETLRGDLLLALKRPDEARKAYDAALAQAALLGQETGLIRLRRDDLGGSTS